MSNEEAAPLRIAGYASLYDRRDLAGDIVRPGAFTASLAEAGAAGVAMLFQHHTDEPIGVWEYIREDAMGLHVEGRLLAAGPRGATARRLVRLGALDGLSIGYRAVRSTRRPDGGRDLLQLNLWEVSLVTFPMLPTARFRVLTPQTLEREAA